MKNESLPGNAASGEPTDEIHAEEPDEQRVKDVTCPQCRKPFILRWQGEERTGRTTRIESRDSALDRLLGPMDLPEYRRVPVTLEIRGCPSGGIYDVHISCPHCDYEEPL